MGITFTVDVHPLYMPLGLRSPQLRPHHRPGDSCPDTPRKTPAVPRQTRTATCKIDLNATLQQSECTRGTHFTGKNACMCNQFVFRSLSSHCTRGLPNTQSLNHVGVTIVTWVIMCKGLTHNVGHEGRNQRQY